MSRYFFTVLTTTSILFVSVAVSRGIISRPPRVEFIDNHYRGIFVYSTAVDPRLSLRPQWVINNCTLMQLNDSRLVVTGYLCQNLPIFNDTLLSSITRLQIHQTTVRLLETDVIKIYPNVTLKQVHLQQNKIRRISEDAFRGHPHIEKLLIIDNPLEVLDKNAFRGLTNLKFLSLFGNHFTRLDVVMIALRHEILPVLEFLDIGDSEVVEIKQNDFAIMENSTLGHFLTAYTDSLTEIHPNAFDSLRNFTALSVRDCSSLNLTGLAALIRNLKQPSYRILDISRIHLTGHARFLLEALAETSADTLVNMGQTLTGLSKNDYPYMPKLKVLIQRFNRVPKVTLDAFDNLPNMEILDFGLNFNDHVPEGIRVLKRIKFLDFGGYTLNRIQTDFDDYVFANMTSLETLIIDNKVIPDLTSKIFFGLTNLTGLALTNCAINYLPVDIFEPLVNLKYLDLSLNPIFLSGTSFKLFNNLYRLELLDIHSTGLHELTDVDLFKNNPLLTFIDAHNNSINEVSPDIFSNNNDLVRVDLSRNHIENWPEDLKSHNIVALDLSFNKIEAIRSSSAFYSYKILNINHNPFHCTCTALPLIELLEGGRNLTLVNANFPFVFKCSEPESASGTFVMDNAPDLKKQCQPFIYYILFIVLLAFLFIGAAFGTGIYYKHRFALWFEELQVQRLQYYTQHFLYDAFVSYSTSDTQWVVNILLPHMENCRNFKLCVYDRDFVPGRNISDCVLESIKNSRKVILVLSNNFLQSPWCRFESELAQYTLLEEKRDAFVLVKISEVDVSKLSPKLSYLLKTRVYLEWKEPEQDAFFSKLHAALRPRPTYLPWRALSADLKRKPSFRTLKKLGKPPGAPPKRFNRSAKPDTMINLNGYVNKGLDVDNHL